MLKLSKLVSFYTFQTELDSLDKTPCRKLKGRDSFFIANTIVTDSNESKSIEAMQQPLVSVL